MMKVVIVMLCQMTMVIKNERAKSIMYIESLIVCKMIWFAMLLLDCALYSVSAKCLKQITTDSGGIKINKNQ